MPRVEQRKARTDIYAKGIKIPSDKTKSGYRRDKSQPNPQGDTKLVNKGQQYYTWSFNFGPSFISLTYPKRSQLTQSDFLSQLYDIEDRIGELSCESAEDLATERDDIVSELQSLEEETQGKFDNMPEGLQQGDTGQLLEERVSALEGFISDLESVDLDYEEPDDEELRTELREEDEDADDETIELRLEERKTEKLDEWLEEKTVELKDVTISL